MVLIDRAGKSASVRAGQFGTALEPSVGSFRRHVVLNGLRIPLSEFKGVDLADLDAIELRFGAATPAGSIQLADVAFQEPPVTAAAPSPTVAAAAPTPLAGAKRVDAIAAGGDKAARAGKLARVQISVERRTAGGCRYLLANGKLTAARSCSAPLALIAKGAKRWSLKSAATLPGGTYTVRVQAIDARGNLERAKTRTLRAR